MPVDRDEARLEGRSWSAPGALALARRIGSGSKRGANWIQLIKFGLVGGSGYLINLAVFAVLSQNLGQQHAVAAVGAFCVAVSNNYLWNRHWTFDPRADRTSFQAVRFFVVSFGGLLVNLAMLQVLVAAAVPELQAQALAVATAMPLNFAGNKLWTFT